MGLTGVFEGSLAYLGDFASLGYDHSFSGTCKNLPKQISPCLKDVFGRISIGFQLYSFSSV